MANSREARDSFPKSIYYFQRIFPPKKTVFDYTQTMRTYLLKS